MGAIDYLCVGSIVELEGSLLMVCGYRAVERNATTELAYFAVPYPYGFVDFESLIMMHADAGYKVITTGYESGTSREFLGVLNEASTQGASTSFQVYSNAMHDVVDAISRGDAI